ncbi:MULTISPECIES: hypothetical protein [Thauera]|jgi:hypothetical protein|uniref:Uncharacterized protein n=2 Tax=Thauera aminoaromatica TaxID=164330 RepID=C4KAH7_THASP|nr:MULTISPECIES: hypothetical protein [Thauera]ACR01403.1 conserved hypothetical protein [Thauera aminoaromatica]ENO87836.1 hypothetical protein C665_03721 [Thauera aminoaromatica S2]MBP6132363.1 hypothetical protein [Thauera sp.]TXH83283.1 MAG: hypothetical protein E6Q80_13785 [Thauera aminoaromatica]HNB06566.1 hypothetical protein [Thauera aminoaromatica]
MSPVAARLPLVALALFGLAAVSLGAALLCFAGLGALLHPALSDPMAGLAFLVSAIALAGTGAFPLVFARLARRDAGPQPPPGA